MTRKRNNTFLSFRNISAESVVVTISSHFYEDNDTSLYYNSNVEFKSGWIGLWSCTSSFVVSQDLINWIGLPFVRKHWPCSYEVVVANILWLFGAATSFLLLSSVTQNDQTADWIMVINWISKWHWPVFEVRFANVVVGERTSFVLACVCACPVFRSSHVVFLIVTANLIVSQEYWPCF